MDFSHENSLTMTIRIENAMTDNVAGYWIILVPRTGYQIMDRFLIWTSWHKRYKWVNDNLINCYFNFLSWLSNQVVLQSKVLEVPWLTNHFHSVRLSWSNISLNIIQDKQKQDEVFKAPTVLQSMPRDLRGP